jgi:hypothetical protein
MSSDYTQSKLLPPTAAGQAGQSFPENAVDSSWSRLEPIITADQLVTRFLVGIPLVSRTKDPRTNKPMVITDDMLRDYIKLAVDEAENETSIDIMPNKYSEKFPFDKAEYDQFGFFKCNHKPVHSVDLLTVRPSDNSDVFTVPLQWVETSYMTYGQINIIPLTLAITSNGITNSQTGGGAVFLNILGQKPWVPAFWGCEYTTGFKDGMVPTFINELIGTIAAMRILSMLAATFARSTSTSLGIDSMSQSVSTPGPQIYKIRMEELAEQRKLLMNKTKKTFQMKFIVGNI